MQKHIPQLFNDRVSTYAEKTVFKFKNKSTNEYESISWDQLKDLTNQVSNSLLTLGCTHGSKIGIFSHNRAEWTITDLGILSIGGIVVPMYATASKHDVKYIINETELEILFIGNPEQLEKTQWLLNECKSLKKVVVYDAECPESDERFISWKDFINLTEVNLKELEAAYNKINEQDLATIIYTSGTTGEPKGAMLTHKNFIKSLEINYERLNIDDTDISLCFLPLSHVFERTWSFFLIYCGATNVFLEDPKKVIEEMPIVKPTAMCTVPRFYEKTYEGIQTEKNNWPGLKQKIFNWSIKMGHKAIEYRKDNKHLPFPLSYKHKLADKLVLSKLRNVFGGKIKALPCAGAAIDSSLLRFFHATGIFINYGYGATETTATVSCFKTDKYSFEYCGSIMPDVDVKIGENNEILVKGDTIFKGYYNKPEETEKILKDGWYYTGDEGEIIGEYLNMNDRIKDLIKTSGGKYVSPQKLELLLSQDEYIDQIVVIGDRRKFITALIVPAIDKLQKIAATFHVENTEIENLINHPSVKDFYQQRIDALQSELTPYEKIIKFSLLPESFTISNNTLTNTLKIKRKVVAEKYAELIDKMYLPS